MGAKVLHFTYGISTFFFSSVNVVGFCFIMDSMLSSLLGAVSTMRKEAMHL